MEWNFKGKIRGKNPKLAIKKLGGPGEEVKLLEMGGPLAHRYFCR